MFVIPNRIALKTRKSQSTIATVYICSHGLVGLSWWLWGKMKSIRLLGKVINFKV